MKERIRIKLNVFNLYFSVGLHVRIIDGINQQRLGKEK